MAEKENEKKNMMMITVVMMKMMMKKMTRETVVRLPGALLVEHSGSFLSVLP